MRQNRREHPAQQTFRPWPGAGAFDIRARLVHKVHIVHPGRASGHAGETRQASVDVRRHFFACRPLVFQHVLDKGDAPARTVELGHVAVQKPQ